MAREVKVPYEKPGVPKGEAYGIAAVTQALEGLDFPATKRQILDRVRGHERIHWTKARTVDLREILEGVDREHFESMAGVVSLVSAEARQEGVTEGEWEREHPTRREYLATDKPVERSPET